MNLLHYICMQTFTERLNEAFNESGLDKTDLWKACSVSSGAVTHWLNGSTKELKGDNLLNVASILKVTPEWLSTGSGRKHRAPTNYSKPPTNGVLIEQYDAHGAMGNGLILRDQSGVINEWQVSDDWLRLNIKNSTGYQNLKIVTGFGDSMKGMFNSGDPLIIDIGVRSVEFDGVYFFRVGNEGFIKRLQRIPGIGLRAISENKSYESWDIKQDMDFEVFGRVLKLWQGVDF